jgi:sulfoxide reductase heme-binding subunit YedZ
VERDHRSEQLLGLFAFFYAVLHFLTYLLDQSFSLGVHRGGRGEAPVGDGGVRGAPDSRGARRDLHQASIRRLGKRWQKLHRLVYLAGALGVLHFFLLVKKDISEPLIFAAVLAVLLAFRLPLLTARKAPRRPAARAAEQG